MKPEEFHTHSRIVDYTTTPTEVAPNQVISKHLLALQALLLFGATAFFASQGTH